MTMAKSNLEQLMDAVVVELGASSVTHLFGRKNLNERGAPPRIVWIAAESEFGGGLPGGNPRKLWIEQQLVEIHVWGRDAAQVRDLWKNELVVLQRLASTSMRPRRITPGAESDHWLTNGDAVVLTVTIDVPVLDELVPTTSATGWTYETESTPGDGWIEAGE
jgi:hypothetical protein